MPVHGVAIAVRRARTAAVVAATRTWDCTPVKVRYGRLQAKTTHRSGSSTTPHAGVLEMMGQIGFLTLPEFHKQETYVIRRERLAHPPVFFARSNSSAQYAAGELAGPLRQRSLRGCVAWG